MERVYLFKTLYAKEEGNRTKAVYKIGHTKQSTARRTRGQLTMTPNAVVEILSLECEKSSKVEQLFQNIFDDTRIKSCDISGTKSRKTEWFELSDIQYCSLIKKFELLRDAFGLNLNISIAKKNKNFLFKNKTNMQSSIKTWEYIGIKNGDNLTFCRNSEIIVTVKNVKNNIVVYKNKEYKLSPLTKILLKSNTEKQGTRYFLYKGRNLAKILGTWHEK